MEQIGATRKIISPLARSMIVNYMSAKLLCQIYKPAGSGQRALLCRLSKASCTVRLGT